MSTILSIGDICEVRAWVVNAEQAAVNSYFFEITAASSSSDTDQALSDAIDTIIAPKYKSALGSDSDYRGTQLYIVTRRPMPAYVSTTASAGFGTASGLTMGRQTSGLIAWRTAFAGPGFRGRTYFPFPTTGEDASGAIPSNGYLTILNGLSTALTGGNSFGVAGTAKLSIFHRTTRTPTTVTSGAPIAKWATQKRRGSYGRANVSPI